MQPEPVRAVPAKVSRGLAVLHDPAGNPSCRRRRGVERLRERDGDGRGAAATPRSRRRSCRRRDRRATGRARSGCRRDRTIRVVRKSSDPSGDVGASASIPRAASSVRVAAMEPTWMTRWLRRVSASTSRAVRIVHELDRDELVNRELPSIGEVPQVGVRDLAHDLVTHARCRRRASGRDRRHEGRGAGSSSSLHESLAAPPVALALGFALQHLVGLARRSVRNSSLVRLPSLRFLRASRLALIA